MNACMHMHDFSVLCCMKTVYVYVIYTVYVIYMYDIFLDLSYVRFIYHKTVYVIHKTVYVIHMYNMHI